MTDHDPHYIPHHLDEPFKLILWTLDEWLVMISPFLFIWLLGITPVVGFILGVLALMGLKKFKGEQGHFYLIYSIYWYLPAIVRFKKIPPSYQREWLG